MILDGEQNKTMRVLLEKGLVRFHFLDASNLGGEFGRLFNNGLAGGHVGDLERRRSVLLACGFEIELLDRRVTHLEVLEGGCSLSNGCG